MTASGVAGVAEAEVQAGPEGVRRHAADSGGEAGQALHRAAALLPQGGPGVPPGRPRGWEAEGKRKGSGRRGGGGGRRALRREEVRGSFGEVS